LILKLTHSRPRATSLVIPTQDIVSVYVMVISDIASPGMNGIQLLMTMKRHQNWRHIPVIIVSGNAGAEAMSAKIRGAFEVFEKPYRFEELLVAVRCALASR
jgi:DNA-binding NtrC family response regulator